MKLMRAWLSRLGSIFKRNEYEQDMGREIESHLQLHIEESMRAGMSQPEAHRYALIKLGGVELTKERYRDQRGFPLIEALIQDTRFGLRILLRSPGFTIIAVATLALGIGANTAIFSVVNAVLLRPLPYPDPGRLVMVWGTDERSGVTEDVASYPDFEDWRSQSTVFENMAAFNRPGATLSGIGDAETVTALQVTPEFFDLLGTAPELGRTFSNDEGEAGGPKVVLIGDSLWQTKFGGDRDALGRTLRINEEPYTIIGVMPPGFSINGSASEAPEVCTPLTPDPNRGHGFLSIIGRLRPMVTISQAQAEMNTITHRLAEQYPKTEKGIGANVESFVDAMVGDVRTGLWILLGVVAVVLLIACANVANLMLSRATQRRKEIAVRAALGAGRGRLMQQMLVESTLLALAGGALGFYLATWGARLLVLLLSQNFEIPRLEDTRADGRVLVFTLAISVATGILFGLVPAMSAISRDLNAVLTEAGRAATQSLRGRRLRGVFVIAETALALVLLTCAGGLLKSFLAIRSTAPGFRAEKLVTARLTLPRLKYAELEPRQQFYERVLSLVAPVPGVRSAALVANLPFGGGSDSMGFHISGLPDPAPGKPFTANFNIASADYFETMGIPLFEGREFTEQDGFNTGGVVIINQAAARNFWPGENPIGKQILLPGKDHKTTTLSVVGITGDVRQSDLARQPKPEVFLSSNQADAAWSGVTLVVRTADDPLRMAGGLKSLAQAADPDVPVSTARTMDEILFSKLAAPRTYTFLLGMFAVVAVILATVGLYGVISYSVTQRTHEIGIRIALGAQRRDILEMVLRQGLALAGAGTALGLAGALAATRLLIHLIPSVKAGDPLTLVSMSMVLLCIATAAILVPSRRATRVAPTLALRCE